MTNQLNRDSKRRQLYKAYELRRTGLNFNINAFSIPPTTRLTSTQKLSSLSRNGSITRTRNRWRTETAGPGRDGWRTEVVVPLEPEAGRERVVTVRILVADDQPVVRDGLALLLSTDADLEVVAVAADGVEAVEAAFASRPTSRLSTCACRGWTARASRRRWPSRPRRYAC